METENKEIPQKVLDKLKEPLDVKAVTQHPTKTYLSSIKAVYVTERFTEAFGLGGWTYKVEIVEKAEHGMIVVKVKFKVPKYGIYYESYGGNDNGGDGNKNFDLGDAYKGATTDALTKIGSYLGVGIDVFKGLVTPKGNGNSKNTSNKNEPTEWLNLFDKTGNETDAYKKLQEAIGAGKQYTLKGIRKNYKVSKQTAGELEKYFGIK